MQYDTFATLMWFWNFDDVIPKSKTEFEVEVSQNPIRKLRLKIQSLISILKYETFVQYETFLKYWLLIFRFNFAGVCHVYNGKIWYFLLVLKIS